MLCQEVIRNKRVSSEGDGNVVPWPLVGGGARSQGEGHGGTKRSTLVCFLLFVCQTTRRVNRKGPAGSPLRGQA